MLSWIELGYAKFENLWGRGKSELGEKCQGVKFEKWRGLYGGLKFGMGPSP